MSYDKLKTDINQLIEKLNELRGFIQINSERSANFKNYLKSSECRENKLKIYLSGAISDLKGLHVIEYNQYSTVDLLKGVYKAVPSYFTLFNSFFNFYFSIVHIN